MGGGIERERDSGKNRRPRVGRRYGGRRRRPSYTLFRHCILRQCVLRQCILRHCILRQCILRQCILRQCVGQRVAQYIAQHLRQFGNDTGRGTGNGQSFYARRRLLDTIADADDPDRNHAAG
ncbi:MAG TPA: hypothetical protein DEB39_10500 [Planctomycetaceae bacterium]|nr:hypothetical protein [Planctomycetaceae bacterium]